MTTFRVVTDLVTLGVTVEADVVTGIQFHAESGPLPENPFARRVAAELREYTEGRRKTFTFPIDPRGTPFQQRVWTEVSRIPYGSVRSYADVARAIGQPGASRAVGAANHHNPIPLVIPCHRVVASNGTLAGFGGGVDLKGRLLTLEGVPNPSSQLALL